jgi:hypothetical protein
VLTTHARLFAVTEGLLPSSCPELGHKVALLSCPKCNALIACADRKVVWQMECPPAAVPVASEGGATP